MYCGSEKSVTKITDLSPSLRKWKVLTAVGIGLGLFAVAMSTVSLTLLIVLRQEPQPITATAVDHTSTDRETRNHDTHELNHHAVQPLRTNKENELLVADIVHKKHFHGERNKRFANCLLDYSEEQKNKTPTAHITGTHDYQEFIFEDNQVKIVSDDWLCNSKYTKAHVAGGMTFIDGFLKVPQDGVYFIYSQVSMEVKNSSQSASKPVVMGHNTMICECSDQEELDKSCKCYTEETNSEQQLSSLKNRPYLQSESLSIGAIKGTHFHGGLFHLTANSYISIVPVVAKDSIDNDSASTKVFARYVNSFYGAFLVSK